MSYECLYCSRTFATPYALKRHISAKHQFINEDEGEASSSQMSYEEPGLWDDDLPTDEPGLWNDDDLLISDQDKENDPITIETQEESEKSNETSEGVDEEIDEEIDDNLIFPLIIDLKDSHGTMLDDAIKDKTHPPNTDWPNDIYREFMEIVMEYQLSNSCGDRILKLINKSKHNPDENLLPKNTKEGRKFLDVNEFPYMKFKTVPITNFQDMDYHFYYQPIIHGIKVLLLQSDINKEFVFKYQKNTPRIYGKQFESNW